jgi:release factor glutamine methyltransferase
LRSIKQTIQDGCEVLRDISDTARLDIELLISFVLRKERSWLLAYPETLISEEDNKNIQILINRRALFEPIAYILGIKSFWDSDFIVNPSVLIPRPETESLVIEAISTAQQIYLKTKKPLSIIDLGSGSGCIGITTLKELIKAGIEVETVHFADISIDALSVAQMNAQVLLPQEVHHKVSFSQSNWFSNIENKFDLVLSNPPYIPHNDPRVYKGAHFEPSIALYADNYEALKGLDDIHQIISQLTNYLTESGRAVIECGDGQADDIVTLSQKYNLKSKVYFDLERKKRGVIISVM